MSCADPIDPAVLADYWIAALGKSEEQALEEHFFACGECASHLEEVIALAQALRELALEGSLTLIVSEQFLQHVAARGMRVRQCAPLPFGSVECTVAAEDNFLIGRLAADLAGAKQVDLSLCDVHGVEKLRMTDIPFRPDAGGTALQRSITYAKTAPAESLIARLIGFDEAGHERLLGQYTFDHQHS